MNRLDDLEIANQVDLVFLSFFLQLEAKRESQVAFRARNPMIATEFSSNLNMKGLSGFSVGKGYTFSFAFLF